MDWVRTSPIDRRTAPQSAPGLLEFAGETGPASAKTPCFTGDQRATREVAQALLAPARMVRLKNSAKNPLFSSYSVDKWTGISNNSAENRQKHAERPYLFCRSVIV
jgi:hypothetical protein